MNDQDYIRKAVELADAWDVVDRFGEDFIESPEGFGTPTKVNDQTLIDALATQLVRQVDAMDEMLTSTGKGTAGIYQGDKCLGWASGPDRTMNTIRAVVESGIL
jgi:hypothetical protein